MGDDLPEKSSEDSELDITPMIDVTFLLLIFFMVTSTMQQSSDVPLAPANNHEEQSPEGMIEITVMAPDTDGAPAAVQVDGNEVSLDDLTAYVAENAENANNRILISCDRDCPCGSLSEVYGACTSEAADLIFFHAIEASK